MKVCHSWIDHLKPFGVCLSAVADAYTFKKGSVFVISSDGQLLQYYVATREWADLGRPKWTAIAPSEGLTLSNSASGARSLFLLSTTGSLVELFSHSNSISSTSVISIPTEEQIGSQNADSEISTNNDLGDEQHLEWFDHSHPEGDRIIGPPGGLINMRSIFMVSENGTVYERYWEQNSEKWIWVSHGHSGVPTLAARPVVSCFARSTICAPVPSRLHMLIVCFAYILTYLLILFISFDLR